MMVPPCRCLCFERGRERLVDIVHPHEGELGARVGRDLLQVAPVALGQNHGAEAILRRRPDHLQDRGEVGDVNADFGGLYGVALPVGVGCSISHNLILKGDMTASIDPSGLNRIEVSPLRESLG